MKFVASAAFASVKQSQRLRLDDTSVSPSTSSGLSVPVSKGCTIL